MRTRTAYIADLSRIVAFCREHEHLLGPDDPKLNAGYLRRQLKQAIREGDQAVFIVCDNDDHLKGVIVCFVAPYIWSSQLYVTDILFVADQGGDVLMKKMIQWGKSQGAQAAAMQTHLGFDPRVEKLYQRKGFTKVGAVFERPI